MQFTPQQLAGAAKYSHKCRIGNWNEDLELEETQLKDYFLKKQKGELLVDKAIKRNELTLQSVPHSYNRDGFVRFGDTVMMQCGANDGMMANNLWDPLPYEIEAFSVTTSSLASPVARNTWVISRVPGDSNIDGDDILRYGQRFMFACNPSLRVDEDSGMVQSPFFLHSELASHYRSSKLSNKQVVCLIGGRPQHSMVWKARRPATRRYVPDGDPVPACEELIIVHEATNQALYCDPRYSLRNDYGVECEVAAYMQQSVKKTHNLVDEWSGATTGDIPSRTEEKVNRWFFVLARDQAASEDKRGLVDMTPEMLLEKVRNLLNEQGNHSFRGLSKIFRLMDQVGDGRLDREDLRFGLADYGVPLTDNEFDTLMNIFDYNHDGVVSLKEFMRVLRGPLNDFRRGLIQRAFNQLDRNGNGVITVEDLTQIFDGSQHPDVLSGRKGPSEVLREFMGQWDTVTADGIVTLLEFEEYYADISATIPHDDYFEQMICSAWNMQRGGK